MVDMVIGVDGNTALVNFIEVYLILCRFSGDLQSYTTGASGYNGSNLSTTL